MNKGSLRALPRRETRQSARIAASSTSDKASDDAAPEVPTPLAEKRKRRPPSAKKPAEPDHAPEAAAAATAAETPKDGATAVAIEQDVARTHSDEKKTKDNEHNETLNEKRANARDHSSSDDDSDSDSSDDDLDSCVEMINTNKANETMLKVNCSLNANNNCTYKFFLI